MRFQIFKRLYTTQVRVRFAPSPTGKLHVGGLRTAFYNYLFAKKHNGKFLLRIEDTDRERLQPRSLENIIESLKWSRITPDLGPGFSQDTHEYSQSNRLHYYKQHVKQLMESGHAYKCFCDSARLDLLRRNALKNQQKVAYDGKCRHLSEKQIQENETAGKPSVIRFKVEDLELEYDDLVYGKHKTNVFQQEGDFILIKSDGFPTYHFANVVDDHLMDITHVLRGLEWQSSVGKHILLYQSFNWQPPQFAHLPLIYHMDGSKLSKRHGNIDVLSYRDRGIFPEALIAYLTTFSGGFRPDENTKSELEQFKFTSYTLEQLVGLFDLSYLTTRPVKYDEQVLLAINKNKFHEKYADLDVLFKLRQLVKQKYTDIDPFFLTDDYLSKILKCTHERVNTLNELLNDSYAYLWVNFKFKNFQFDLKTAEQKQQLLGFVDLLIEFIGKNLNDNVDLASIKKDLDLEFKNVKKIYNFDTNLWNLFRILLCGTKQGPPVVDILSAFGKQNTLYRLNSARKCFV